MTWDVRPCASRGDLLEAIRPISHYFGYAPTEQSHQLVLEFRGHVHCGLS